MYVYMYACTCMYYMNTYIPKYMSTLHGNRSIPGRHNYKYLCTIFIIHNIIHTLHLINIHVHVLSSGFNFVTIQLFEFVHIVTELES